MVLGSVTDAGIEFTGRTVSSSLASTSLWPLVTNLKEPLRLEYDGFGVLKKAMKKELRV